MFQSSFFNAKAKLLMAWIATRGLGIINKLRERNYDCVVYRRQRLHWSGRTVSIVIVAFFVVIAMIVIIIIIPGLRRFSGGL